MATVAKEIWTGEMIKSLRGLLTAGFLKGIPDNSSIVKNDVIHLVDVGVDPDVLINNTTYPIDIQNLDDNDKAISLDKFQTKVTPITDDELYAISYDKMGRVKEAHANAIYDAEIAKAAHALCATKNTATTPVLKTTGEKDSTTGRKAMTKKDLIAMKEAMDKLGVPTAGRRLVLCPEHVSDLLNNDKEFDKQYKGGEDVVARRYGFDIYEYGNTPIYTKAGTKKTINTAGSTGEFHCSFAFYTKRTFLAKGSLQMYYSEAATDPTTQRNLINFRHYFICMPKKEDAGVVMMSAHEA